MITCGFYFGSKLTVPYAGLFRQTVQQIVDVVLQQLEGTRLQVMAPLVRGRSMGLFGRTAQGYIVRIDGEIRELEEEINLDRTKT